MTAFEVVIRLGRSFDVQTGNGAFAAGVREITIPFLDRESAEAAQREIEVSVRRVHDAGGEDYRVVVPGDVVESGETVVVETVTLPTEEQMRAMRRARLEYTDTHGGWMNAESRAELDALRAADPEGEFRQTLAGMRARMEGE